MPTSQPSKRDTLVLLRSFQYTAFRFGAALLLDSPTPALEIRESILNVASHMIVTQNNLSILKGRGTYFNFDISY